jgi:PIN domain nuclease of toxin-antitoxin system
MRLLLDTHIVLWQLSGSRSIGSEAQRDILAADELLFSVVSFAEIGVKAAIGKLRVPADLRSHLVGAGIRILGLTPEHGLGVAALPLHHRDPFDRLLIAQARAERVALMTADARILAYDVTAVDASH